MSIETLEQNEEYQRSLLGGAIGHLLLAPDQLVEAAEMLDRINPGYVSFSVCEPDNDLPKLMHSTRRWIGFADIELELIRLKNSRQ